MDYALSQNLRRSTTFAMGEYSVWNDIFDGRAGTEVAVYGSSRAWVHVDTKILQEMLEVPVYNFGIDGHNFWLQYLRHLLLLKHNDAPKTILFCVDMFTLEKKAELYNADQFLPYMLFDRTIKKYTATYQGFSGVDYFIPMLRYYGKRTALFYASARGFVEEEDAWHRYRGYAGMDLTWNDDLEAAKQKKAFYEVELDQPTLALFEQFLESCRHKGIQVILLYPPEYIEGQTYVRNRLNIMEIYRDIARRYTLPFLDYSDHPLSHDKSNFYNASHLHRAAAELFSTQLAQDVRPLIHHERP